MKRTLVIKLFISLSILTTGVWYFIIKDYNYVITFTSTQAPGIIYHNLLLWNHGEDPRNKIVSTHLRKPFSELQQQVALNDSVFKYRWVIKRKNDSITKVMVFIKDQQNSFLQNLNILFYKTPFVKRTISTVKKVQQELMEHTKYYAVSAVQKGEIPPVYHAYITLKSAPENKAATMIKHIPVIMNYIKGHNIAITGDPFLEITYWNSYENLIKFNFCFPVKEHQIYPESVVVRFKKNQKRSALKTIYNGNYKWSDRAWYTIMAYADIHHIELESLPLEIYRNDPHSGENELQWTAEVYMPLTRFMH